MPRPKIIRSRVYPYHVRSRANNREWFYLPPNRIWEMMCEKISAGILLYKPLIHAFVLMNNHIHMILSTPEGNIDAFMQYFVRESAKAIGYESGRINRIFGGRYQRSLITNEVYFRNAMKYVFRNPVASGICAAAEDYSYSTLPWTLGRSVAGFELSEEPGFLFKAFPRDRALLDWLAKAYSARQSSIIQRGLRRATFQWPKHKRFRRDVQALSDM